MNISNFITWFLTEFYRIGTQMLSNLDQITIYGNITLMQFIITIAILGVFVSIIITAPKLGIVSRTMKSERKGK